MKYIATVGEALAALNAIVERRGDDALAWKFVIVGPDDESEYRIFECDDEAQGCVVYAHVE